MSKTSLLLAALLIGTLQIHSQIIAFDNASDSVYDDGWQTGDNGGFGLGAWTIFAGQTLVTPLLTMGILRRLATSIPREGHGESIVLVVGGTLASRALGADLQVGQKLLIDVDFGNSIGQVFALRDGEQGVFAFYTAGQTYQVIGTTSQDTGIPLTFDGISFGIHTHYAIDDLSCHNAERRKHLYFFRRSSFSGKRRECY